MDGSASMEDNSSYKCSAENDVAKPRDNVNRDVSGANKPAVNQQLDSTQDHHLQIEESSENSEIYDTDSSYDCCQKSIENRKCDRHGNLAVSAIDQEEERAGHTFFAEDECRICQSDGDEALINPCKCSGSAKWVHESCIVKWFQISETSSCELCARDVSIKKTTKPLYQWRLPRGSLGPCSRVDLWYLFVTAFSLCTIIGFGIFHLLVKSKEPETTAVFGAIYALCGVMILLRIHYFYMWFTRRSGFWRKWKTMNRVWTVTSPKSVLNVNEDITMV